MILKGMQEVARLVRRRTGSLLVDNFFRGAAVAGRLHPNARASKHHVQIERDIPYLNDGSSDHLLDIYSSTKRPGPWPCVLYVHGGGFRFLSKDSHWVMGLAFARRGCLVFNINYRLAPRHRFPAALQDVCAAMSWILREAPRHGGDPERLVLAGESAGANLITALTLIACYPRPEPWAEAIWRTGAVPRAVLPACGIYQVTDVGRFGRRRRMPLWVRDYLEEVEPVYLGPGPHDPRATELADPLLVLERGDRPGRPLPPFLLTVGTKDPLLDDTRRLAAALEGLGAPCEARYYPGEIHAFHAIAFREQAIRHWRDTYRFLDRHAF
jgi:acetyl esterase